eukprot:g15943.t1
MPIDSGTNYKATGASRSWQPVIAGRKTSPAAVLYGGGGANARNNVPTQLTRVPDKILSPIVPLYREVEAAANQYEDDEQEESYNNSSSSQSGPRPHHHQQEHSSSFAESDSAGTMNSSRREQLLELVEQACFIHASRLCKFIKFHRCEQRRAVAKQQLQRGELVQQRGTQLAALWKEMKILQKLKEQLRRSRSHLSGGPGSRSAGLHLLEEDEASSSDGHPHIANLHAFVETRSDLWFVLENGGTPISKQLSHVKGEFVRNTRMYRVHHLEWYEELKNSLHPLRFFLRQVLAAFAFLHSADCEIAHADVKPENILRNAQSGLVKLCDFGSAFSAREDAPSSLGTPEYMAPEQLDRQINWQQTSTGGGGASSSGGRYSSTAGGGSGGVTGRISAIISTGGGSTSASTSGTSGGGPSTSSGLAPRTSATELARRDALINKYCGAGSAAATSSAPAKGGPSSVAAAPPVGGGARDDAKVLEHLAGDMWSVGMIFLELCHGVPLWLSYDCCVGQRKTQGLLGASGRDFRKIRQKQISVVKSLEALLRRDCFGLQIGDSELALNFLACLLQPNPRERLTAPESLAHPFLAAD